MKRILPLLLLTAIGFCGCAHRPQPAEDQPLLSLKLAVNDIYCTQTACSCVHDVAARTYEETQQQLLKQFGVDLTLVYYEEPYELEKAILAGTYDGVISKPWTALMLTGQANTEFERVADILDPEQNRWLTGIVVVMADSETQTLAELDGKRIVIGQPDAYEKHYAAKRLFARKRLAFAQVEQTASCIENLGKLMDGLVDAAVVSDYALSADCAVDFANPKDFRILAATEKIPLTSVMFDTRRVPAEARARVKTALLALSENGAPESMLSKGFVKPAPWNPVERSDAP